jgi:hypothetical protein
VGAKSAFLRQILLFIPEDNPVRAGLDDLSLPHGLFRIDYYNPVAIAGYRSVGGRFHAGGISAMLAQYRHIGYLDIGIFTPLLLYRIDPELSRPGLSGGIRRIIILPVLILAGGKTAIASGALR